MSWEPTPEDIEWTKGVIENLEDGQDWMEGEMAFRKTGKTTLSLLTRTERSEGAAERVRVVLDILGWELDESESKIVPDDPTLAAEMMQKEAQSWMCPKCEDFPVVNMDLTATEWGIMGNTQYIDESGNAILLDRWVVGIKCGCGEKIYLSPDDYYLIAGERLFYTWEGLTPISPEQITVAVDEGFWEALYVTPLGSERDGNPVPPHMRGLICTLLEGGEEE